MGFEIKVVPGGYQVYQGRVVIVNSGQSLPKPRVQDSLPISPIFETIEELNQRLPDLMRQNTKPT